MKTATTTYYIFDDDDGHGDWEGGTPHFCVSAQKNRWHRQHVVALLTNDVLELQTDLLKKGLANNT